MKQITSSVLQKWSTVEYSQLFFAKSSILDVSLGSEYVSDYSEGFSIIINRGFHSESFRNFSNLFSILLVLSIGSRKFPVRCNKGQKQSFTDVF